MSGLARFLFQSGHYSRSANAVRPGAFLPKDGQRASALSSGSSRSGSTAARALSTAAAGYRHERMAPYARGESRHTAQGDPRCSAGPLQRLPPGLQIMSARTSAGDAYHLLPLQLLAPSLCRKPELLEYPPHYELRRVSQDAIIARPVSARKAQPVPRDLPARPRTTGRGGAGDRCTSC